MKDNYIYFTVTLNVLVIPLHFTVILAVPFFLPVTTPLEDTVATLLLLVLYVTLEDGTAFALIVTFLPFLMLADDFARVKDGFATLTVTVFVSLPAVTVILTVPAFLPVTTPDLLTVAIFVLLDLKETFAVVPYFLTCTFAVFPTYTFPTVAVIDGAFTVTV